MQLTDLYILMNTFSSFGVNLDHLGTIFGVIDGQHLYILLLLKTWDCSLFWLRNNFQTGCSCLWSLAWSHVPPLGRTSYLSQPCFFITLLPLKGNDKCCEMASISSNIPPHSAHSMACISPFSFQQNSPLTVMRI